MRILVADRFPADQLVALADRDHECRHAPELEGDALADALPGHDLLVVRGTRVTSATLEPADRLRLVIRAGSGTNTIDADAAGARGIAVCNVPGGNAAAVAELALGLMLALDRRIPDCVADLRAGRWRKLHYSGARGLLGRRLGVVGLGQTGLAVAERAAAFGMHVHAIDKPQRPAARSGRADRLGTTWVADLGALAEACEILTFHLPLRDDTRGIVGHDLLTRVAAGTWIINTSRGELIDEEALLHAMDHKGVRAGLDVFTDEPATGDAEFDSPLARHPGVYATHHIGASTQQAQEAVATEVVRMVDRFANGELLHCVNRELLARAGHDGVVRAEVAPR